MSLATVHPSEVYLVLKKDLREDLHQNYGMTFLTFDALKRSVIGACRNGRVVYDSVHNVNGKATFRVNVTIHGNHVVLRCLATGDIEQHSGMPTVHILGAVR
jgi:hypothetical protein